MTARPLKVFFVINAAGKDDESPTAKRKK